MDRFEGSNPPDAAWESWFGRLVEGSPVLVGFRSRATFVRVWESDDVYADVRIGSAIVRVAVDDLTDPDAP